MKEAEHSAGLQWPLRILGIALLPPILYCVLFFSTLDEGHPPGMIIPLGYLFLVGPFALPTGLWLSARAYKAQGSGAHAPLLVLLAFIVGTIAWCAYFLPSFFFG